MSEAVERVRDVIDTIMREYHAAFAAAVAAEQAGDTLVATTRPSPSAR
jgi:hypothetical protein